MNQHNADMTWAWSVIWFAVGALLLCTSLTAADDDAKLEPSEMVPNFPSIVMPFAQGLQLHAENASERIYQGVNARWDYSRHQASVRDRRKDELYFGAGHICGGALITPSAVVSAAHCFIGSKFQSGLFLSMDKYIVVLGTMNRFQRSADMIIFSVARFLSPSSLFDLSTFNQDIALLILNGSIPKHNTFVRPIKMHDTAQIKNSFCEVTGWGKNEWGYSADMLKIVEVPVLDLETCQHDTKYNKSVILPGMMCAGSISGGGDACTGDSGGPFVCRGKLAGIVSWGFKCGFPGYPGIYTDIVYYKDWIGHALQLHPTSRPPEVDEDLERANRDIYSMASRRSDFGIFNFSASIIAVVVAVVVLVNVGLSV